MQFLMFTFFQKITQHKFTLFWCYTFVLAMLYSKFLMSVSTIALLGAALLNIKGNNGQEKRSFLVFNTQIKQNFQYLIQQKVLYAPVIWFLAVGCTAFYATSDASFLAQRLQMKLPFLLLPIAFAAMPRFSEREVHKIFAFFTYIATASALIVLVRYSINFKFLTQKIGEGTALPTPTNHIRYSLMIAYAAMCAVYLYYKDFRWKYAWESHLLIGCAFFLGIFQHILAVRSGIAALYLCILVIGTVFFFQQKKYIAIAMIWFALFSLPIIGYHTLPSFKIRMQYAYWEWQQFREGKINNSDSDRWISIQAGMAVGNAHPFFGVGVGNLGVETHAWQRKNYPNIATPKLPHHQLVGIYASMGCFGVLVFCWMLVNLWITSKIYLHPLGGALCLILLASFMVEDTFDTVQGTAMGLFFTMLLWNVLRNSFRSNFRSDTIP
jgi:O-antigen ligase